MDAVGDRGAVGHRDAAGDDLDELGLEQLREDLGADLVVVPPVGAEFRERVLGSLSTLLSRRWRISLMTLALAQAAKSSPFFGMLGDMPTPIPTRLIANAVPPVEKHAAAQMTLPASAVTKGPQPLMDDNVPFASRIPSAAPSS